MGHKTNVIGFRLGLGIYWDIIAVTLQSTYSKMLHKMLTIKIICNILLANYSTAPDKRRNDKTLEQKNRGLQVKIIKNAFVSANMIFSDKVIRLAKKLEVSNNFLDGALLEKKMQEHKDPSKKDSSYLKPKSWKRFLPLSLFAYINDFFRFTFCGKHTRNVSAQIFVKYILQKLGQYFTISLLPNIYD